MSRRPAPPATRILVVDDHPMMREGLVQLISHEPDLHVCAEAETAGQALAAVDKHRPELVLVDISLPDKSGLELIKDLRARQPGLLLLVISMHDEALYAERVLRAGARGYIMKNEGGRKLMEAIRQVLAGKVYVSDRMSARLLESISTGPRIPATESPVQRLSDREFEVFQLIGQGRESGDIAARLHISLRTVEVHRANIRRKLQIETVPALIRFAVQWCETQSPRR